MAIHGKWQGNVLICACKDVRCALVYWDFLSADVFTSHQTYSSYHHVVQCMQASSTTPHYCGLVFRDGQWLLSE
eukprot:11514072-Prorocentrum_lima.AAC.1